MARLVQKFGGTSVGDPDRIREVADYVARSPPTRRRDRAGRVGDGQGDRRTAAHRGARCRRPVPGGRWTCSSPPASARPSRWCAWPWPISASTAESYTGSQAGFITDTNHTNAKILEVRADRIAAALDAGRVPVVAGAQGVSTDHNVTFLGRGGSDTTAVALAKALGADFCELYTDVSGVFTTDPRVVPQARKMSTISFDELLEMTATGCPKPAMRSVEYAVRHGVTLHVRSAFTWEPGTWSSRRTPPWNKPLVRAITHDLSEAKVTVSGVPDQPGVAAKLFRALAEPRSTST